MLDFFKYFYRYSIRAATVFMVQSVHIFMIFSLFVYAKLNLWEVGFLKKFLNDFELGSFMVAAFFLVCLCNISLIVDHSYHALHFQNTDGNMMILLHLWKFFFILL